MQVLLSEAISLLQSGHVVAVPTETVYGLAACLNQPQAIEQIFVLKGRPLANPLIIHLADWRDLQNYVLELPKDLEVLAKEFWPGPLTCVLSAYSSIPSIVRAGLTTAAFRIPALEITRELIKATGPLVMPSANLSGRPSATRKEHVEDDFGKEFPVLEGEGCFKGVESTVILYREGRWGIIRLGAIAAEAFKPILGYLPEVIVQKDLHAQPLCPGQLFRHYAPLARLIFGDTVSSAPFVLGFKERVYPPGKRIIILGSLFSPEEVAENLYQALRQLDLENAQLAWVDMDFPREGLWQTIADRLLRASQG